MTQFPFGFISGIDGDLVTVRRYDRNAEIDQGANVVILPTGHEVVNTQHFNILVEGLAEIKATCDGHSDQPIAVILEAILEEIEALNRK